MTRPYILAECHWKTVKDATYDLAILPWGATEAHNYHLPYGTDIVEAEEVAAESARRAWEKGARLVVLPAIPFGVNTGQWDVKLDINMNPSTQMAVLRDIMEVLDRQGIHKLIILNSHGGNDFRTMIRELGLKFPRMSLFQCNWFQSVDQSRYFTNKDDHAGEMETSVMMHLRPEWVLPLKEAGEGKGLKYAFSAIREGWAWAERKWTQVTKDTGVGNPAEASAAKGVTYLEAVNQKVSAFFFEVATTPPERFYS
ncbi:MAG: creatininase family protein [Bacteroidetes bacterium]|nr:creatininase family protein [Bacteroidota bacterium]